MKQSIKTGMHSGRAVNPINYQVAVADPAAVPGSGVRLAAADDEPGGNRPRRRPIEPNPHRPPPRLIPPPPRRPPTRSTPPPPLFP